MSELSREQVEARLINALDEAFAEHPDRTAGDVGPALVPTVAAMLDERDRQARAEVVQQVALSVERALKAWDIVADGTSWRILREDVRDVLKEVSVAVGAPPRGDGASSGADHRGREVHGSGGRTEPQCQSRPGHKVHFFRLGSTCQCGEVNAG